MIDGRAARFGLIGSIRRLSDRAGLRLADLVKQNRAPWSFEVEARPFKEKW
jgi:hypothetical protein